MCAYSDVVVWLCPIDPHEPNLDISMFNSVEVESLYGSWANINVEDPLHQFAPGKHVYVCIKLVCSKLSLNKLLGNTIIKQLVQTSWLLIARVYL